MRDNVKTDEIDGMSNEPHFTGILPIDQDLEQADEKLNERGNRIRRIHLSTEFDHHNLGREWQRFVTENDAPYFGLWVNKPSRRILAYIVDGLSLVQCDSDEKFDEEMAMTCRFESPSKFGSSSGLDEQKMKNYFKERAELFIDSERARAFYEEEEYLTRCDQERRRPAARRSGWRLWAMLLPAKWRRST